MRDNFSAKTIATLSKRVAYLCSNPDCARSTVGPAKDENKTVSVGEAAHITAASPGGPRYDPFLTAEERSSPSNGIWLCEVCAKLIDSDVPRFPANLLRKWKRGAVERAFTAVATAVPGTRPQVATILQLDDADREYLRGLGLPGEDDVDRVTARMREAARAHIETFRNMREWPVHAIPLNLSFADSYGPHSLNIDGVAQAIGVSDGLSLVAPPGTGKTTTLVQLADAILASGQVVAALVPFGEWSDRLEDFFAFLTRRNAFRMFREQHFMQLAYHGRLVLLLDGWNELDPASQKRATRDLKALRRDFPLLGVVVSTRRHALPISGLVIEIEPLSEEQQLELARALRGKDGEAIVDQAWRTPGVRELISIPLYLNALLASAPGGAFPKTKEEVLRIFVTQHEQVPEKAETLRQELFGFHKDMLVGLAVEANRTANTVISDTNARTAIKQVEDRLIAQKQLTTAPQPTTVLDVLVSSHILIRSASGAGGVSFQHQQFQEWYASFYVEHLMLEAACGNADTRKLLRANVLNLSPWEESVLFACERLSCADAVGARAVGAAILDALAIDPMLAADMIYRAAPEAWPPIKDKVVAFAKRWHRPGKVDRAIRYMIMSGRAEFAPYLWPLISNANDQIHLRALRAAPRFRPSALGTDAAKQLAALPEEIRAHVVAEIAGNSGFEGMELAAALAKPDPSARVVVAVLQSLQFRHADRFVGEILEAASDEVWQQVAREGYPDDLTDSAQEARLAEERRKYAAGETDPLRTIGYLTEHKIGGAETGDRIAKLIQSADFPIKNEHAERIITRAFDSYPHQVATALLHRVAAGMELSFGCKEFLKDVPPVDDGPIAVATLDKATPDHVARAAIAVVGPKTVGVMMDQLFALDDEFGQKGPEMGESARKEYHRLMGAIAASRQTSFLIALLERFGSEQPRHIRLMADLLARHGKGEDEGPLEISKAMLEPLLAAVQQWIKIMLISPDANRHQFSDVARAAQRLAQPQAVRGLHQMLERDLGDWARSREEYFRARRGGHLTPDVTHSYTNQYRAAFAAIGGAEVVALMKAYLPDLRFGFDAACVLMEIWRGEHPSDKDKRFSAWPDFSDVKERRLQRQDPQHPLETSDYAEAIFAVVRDLTRNSKDDATQRHALQLSKIGLALPHGSKGTEIDALVNLGQPYAAKRELLAAAAVAGELLSADVLLAGVQELLEVAKKESWRLDESRGELMGWIELFPFSDRPAAVLESIDLLPPEHRHHWRLRRLLSALGNSPHPEAQHVLEALAQRDPRLLEEYDWLKAVMDLGTESSTRMLLDLVCEGKMMGSHGGVDTWRLAQYMAGLIRNHSELRNELLRRYEHLPKGQAKAVLELILADLADVPIILTMIRSYAADGKPYDSTLSKAIRGIVVGRRPAADWAGAYEEFSVEATGLRKQLFGIFRANNAQTALAEACLTTIEKLRDEHGRIDDEPRHPDIDSGLPWPTAAAER